MEHSCGFEVDSCGWVYGDYLIPCDPLGGAAPRTNACAHTGTWCMGANTHSGGWAQDFDFSEAAGTITLEFWYCNCGLIGGTDFGQLKVRDCDAGTWLYDDHIGTTPSGENIWHLYQLDISLVAGRGNIRIFIGAATGNVRKHFDDVLIEWIRAYDCTPIPPSTPYLEDDCGDMCILDHVLGWEEKASRVMAKKRVIGRCCPTPAPEEAYVTMPREIRIIARMSRAERECIEDLWNCCEWLRLYDVDNEFIDYVWMEKPNFRWDSSLGCGEEPWIANISLVCSST